MNLIHLISSIIKGYSLLRAYENDYVKKIKIDGTGIDLGAKSKNAKYYEYFNLEKVTHIDFVDYYSGNPGIVELDLEKPLKLKSSTYNFVLMFNILEHIYNYKNLFDETVRILRSGGKLHGFVPFMFHYHPDPNDYFRFSEQALTNILKRKELFQIKAIPICYGPFKVVASVIAEVLKNRVMRAFLYASGICLDKILMKISSGGTRYSMAYYFTATKK